MTETLKALYSFWSSFGIPAFPENDIPDEKPKPGEESRYEMPYITYQLIEPESGESAAFYARVWYRSEGYAAIAAKIDEIKNRIGQGVKLTTPNGYICIYAGNPFSQFQPLQGVDVKAAYLNMIMLNAQH